MEGSEILEEKKRRSEPGQFIPLQGFERNLNKNYMSLGLVSYGLTLCYTYIHTYFSPEIDETVW